MAEQKKSILGNLRGKVGGNIYREVNGKTIVSKASDTHNTSQLPHEIDKRNIQKVNGKFASIINQNKLLHVIWEKEKFPCTNAYNKINKVNYHFCAPDHPTEKAQITPGGFKLKVKDISIFPEGIEVTPDPIKLNKDEAAIAWIMILSFWNPKRKSKKTNNFEFLPFENYTSDGPKLIFKLNKQDIPLTKKYKGRTAFLAAVILSEENKIMRWTETLSRNLL